VLLVDYDSILSQYSRWFLWTTWKFYFPPILVNKVIRVVLEGAAGPFDNFAPPEASVTVVT
jgi:phosphatidylglycerol phospholipase C